MKKEKADIKAEQVAVRLERDKLEKERMAMLCQLQEAEIKQREREHEVRDNPQSWMNLMNFGNLHAACETRGSSPEVYSPAVDRA